MRTFQALRGLALGAACTALAVAAPIVLTQADRITKDADLKKVSRALGEWLEALEEGDSTLEAEQDFREELEKLNDKKLKGGDLLASPADAGQLIYLAGGFERKAPKRANGKVRDVQVDLGARGKVDYAIWTPSKYKAKDGPYTVLITIPDEGVSPEKHITDFWVDNDFRDRTIIAAPKMPGDASTWTDIPGLTAVMLTLREVQAVYAYDATRMFLGGRGRGGETALAIANMFPGRFAGAFSWAGDAGAEVSPENLRSLPTFISGGGSRATAFAEAAAAAGLDNVTLESGGGEAEIISWMEDKRRPGFPAKITIIPGKRFPTSAYWAQFAKVPEADADKVRLDAEVNRETNTITLTGAGIAEATVYFSDGLVDLSKPVTVIANGQEHVETFDRSVNVFLQLLQSGKNDPGRVSVASKQYHLPATAESDG